MTDLKGRAAELYWAINKLYKLNDELRIDTYGGNGDAHWPDPNIQLGKKDKHKESPGIYIKNEQNYHLSKNVDYQMRRAVGHINKAMCIIKYHCHHSDCKGCEHNDGWEW